jgi:HD-GYP domain-containing protein (c-di-GMP phosphodiesterase class II)
MSDVEHLFCTASIGPGVPSRMIEAWGEALERKDPGTWSHCKLVAVFAKILAQALGLENKKRYGSLLTGHCSMRSSS